MATTKSVKIVAYSSSYISSIPDVNLLLGPLIEIEFLDVNGAAVNLAAGETFKAQFGIFNGLTVLVTREVVGVRVRNFLKNICIIS